jgi:hypothetical protein
MEREVEKYRKDQNLKQDTNLESEN